VAQKVVRGVSQPGCPWTRSMSVKLTPGAEYPPSMLDGQLGPQRNVGVPTVTLALERSAGRSPYHQRGNPCSPERVAQLY